VTLPQASSSSSAGSSSPVSPQKNRLFQPPPPPSPSQLECVAHGAHPSLVGGVVETRVPVVLLVGGPGAGKTAVSAALLWDAVAHQKLRVTVYLILSMYPLLWDAVTRSLKTADTFFDLCRVDAFSIETLFPFSSTNTSAGVVLSQLLISALCP